MKKRSAAGWAGSLSPAASRKSSARSSSSTARDDIITDPRCAHQTYNEARCEKELRYLRSGEPGAVHCSYDNHAEIFPFMHDWVAARV